MIARYASTESPFTSASFAPEPFRLCCAQWSPPPTLPSAVTAPTPPHRSTSCASTRSAPSRWMPCRGRTRAPGTPMALAPLAYVLYTRVMHHNPRDPAWPDRDRFVLSADTRRCCCTRRCT